MKQIPPSTLRAHLAQSREPDPHPDPDILTAFAEDALLDRERTDVLTHLAACPDCRAVVHAAAAAEPDRESEGVLEPRRARRPQPEFLPEPVSASSPLPASPPEPIPARRPIRTWFPGIALAASILVMAASTIFFYRALHSAPAPVQTAAGTAVPEIPAAPAPVSIPAAVTSTQAEPKRGSASKHGASPASSAILHTEEARLGAAAPPMPAAAAGVSSHASCGDLSARRAQNALPPADESQAQAETDAEVSAYRSAMAQAKAARGSPTTSATQSVDAEARSTLTRSLQNPQPVAGFVHAPPPRPQFRISSAGQLERSTQTGIWVPIPVGQGIRFRVVAISGADVWAGGDHLRLFHSVDGGATWTEVQLPSDADRTHAIVHIRVDTPQKFTVEDDAGSTWSSIDGGSTWR